MSFICAAMSGVGDIVQAKRERGSGQARVRTARRQRPAGGGVMKSWAGLLHCQELARSQEQETRSESEQ